MNNIKLLEQQIENGGVAIGTYITFSDCITTELLGLVGYDFLWVDMEHTPIDKSRIAYHCIAAKAANKPVFIRVPCNDPAIVKPILDIGVDAMIIPDVRSREAAEMAIASCLYPPEGLRGFGPVRATCYGQEPVKEYIKRSKKDFWKIIQIEHIEAVKIIDDILSVPGIDSVLIGPNDLSGSAGVLGDINHPTMEPLYDTIARACKRRGIPFGVAIAYDADTVKKWIKRGVSWISVGADFGHIVAGAKQALEETRKATASRE